MVLDANRFDRVDLQHPGPGHRPQSGGPRLRDPAGKRQADRSTSTAGSSRTASAPRSPSLVEIREPAEFAGGLAALAFAEAKVLLDPQTAASAIERAIREPGGTIVEGSDPVLLPKARKNPVELAGARRAHLRDGAAMVRFLAWLDRTAPSGGLDEVAAADQLAYFRANVARRDGSELVDLSFDTISGAGPNGAIVHYRATPETSRRLETGTLYLVDSGGQYPDGTTDITRTVAIGTPTDEMRDRFTRVLKGHIAIATARFPAGTTGAQIDALARFALWQAGLDYDHGTGHGIGSFLSVHEGPARISKLGHVPLEPGMILSDEPGYYKPGAYGIRIENLVMVDATRSDPGRRPRHARLRDADALPDRPAAGRALADDAGGDRLARRLSRAGRRDAAAAPRQRRARVARGSDEADRARGEGPAQSEHFRSAALRRLLPRRRKSRSRWMRISAIAPSSRSTISRARSAGEGTFAFSRRLAHQASIAALWRCAMARAG